MNYFKIMNRFWDEATELDGYKTDHSALFFAVLDSINRNDWRDTQLEYDRIINKVRLGKKNYLAAREWLVLNRFITLTVGRGNYAKAKFGLGNAVLGRTASSTGIDTGTDSLPSLDEVLGKTGISTGSNPGTDTGSDTHLIKEPITTNLLPKQQHPDPADAVVEKKGEVISFEEKKEGQNTPPQPLPSADEVRLTLMGSGAHWRYASERLKIAKTETDYLDLIEVFVNQQEMKAKDGGAVFPEMHKVKEHFMNWLGKRTELNQQKNGKQNQPNKPAGRLEPVPGEGFGAWGGSRFARPDRTDDRKAG